jgi:SAM-dependent methyltransferase
MISVALPSGDERARLEASAPLARVLADRLCATKLGHDSCAALHVVWQDLRRLGLAATPQRHAEFFSRFLTHSGSSRSPRRVLISAAADFGMLELVVDAHRAVGVPVEPTVVDLCPTPLLLCAWYGAQVGIPVRTLASDFLAVHDPEAFDVVCTHSVLRSFPRAAQAKVLAHWREQLRPGGALVTVTRIDVDGDSPVSASAAQADAFAARAEAEARRVPALAPEAADLAARARRFAAAAVSHPVGSERDLVALVEAAGLVIEHLEVRRIGGALTSEETAPGAVQPAHYAELVAVRR